MVCKVRNSSFWLRIHGALAVYPSNGDSSIRMMVMQMALAHAGLQFEKTNIISPLLFNARMLLLVVSCFLLMIITKSDGINSRLADKKSVNIQHLCSYEYSYSVFQLIQ